MPDFITVHQPSAHQQVRHIEVVLEGGCEHLDPSTRDELEHLALRFSWFPMRISVRVPFEFRMPARHATVEILMEVPHRENGRPTRVCFSSSVDIRRKALVPFIRECIIAALTHEVDEQIHVRGERLFDPHRGEQPLVIERLPDAPGYGLDVSEFLKDR
jgi:hypothetical protein